MPVGFPDYYGGLTLPVTVQEGGTGQTSFPVNSVLIGQGTSGLIASNVGTAGQVLQIPSGGGAPTFQNLAINAGAISGILPIANGGTGTPSPALVAGSNIAISGSWPNQTISLLPHQRWGLGMDKPQRLQSSAAQLILQVNTRSSLDSCTLSTPVVHHPPTTGMLPIPMGLTCSPSTPAVTRP